MPEDDIGLRLMQLYRLLRGALDRSERNAIKAKIDALMAEVQASVTAPPLVRNEAPPADKTEDGPPRK